MLSRAAKRSAIKQEVRTDETIGRVSDRSDYLVATYNFIYCIVFMDRRAEERDDWMIQNRLTKSETPNPIIEPEVGHKQPLIHLDFERAIKLRDSVKKLEVWRMG